MDGYPDEEERTEEAVDMLGHDGIGAVAIEHTRIEAYPSQTLDNVRMYQLFESLPSRFGSRLPRPGYYTLSVEMGAAAGVRGDLEELANAVEHWVRETVPMLPEPEIPPVAGDPTMPGRDTRTTAGDPVSAAGGTREEGSIRVTLLFTGGIESNRVVRVRTSLERKTPKLESAHTAGGATLLVLESRGFVLTNDVVVDQAIYEAAQGFAPLPDLVALVDTPAGDGAWREPGVKLEDLWLAAALALRPA